MMGNLTSYFPIKKDFIFAANLHHLRGEVSDIFTVPTLSGKNLSKNLKKHPPPGGFVLPLRAGACGSVPPQATFRSPAVMVNRALWAIWCRRFVGRLPCCVKWRF
jgi:hypothetical protein